MLSRIAENIYWMGRYVERAENTARLLDVNYHALMEAPFVPGAKGIVTEQWAPLLTISGTEEAFRDHFDKADAQSVPLWMTLHRDNASSSRASLSYARENALTLRERISTEMWEMINRTYLSLCIEADGELEEDSLHDYCTAARDASHLFFGIADATLPRDLGWYFMRAGQYLERADNTLRTLTVRYRQSKGQAPVAEGVELHRGMALLKSLSAYEAFRKRYHDGLSPEHIADFLLLDPLFPRSVRFSARVVAEIASELAKESPGTSGEAERRAGWLSAQLNYAADASTLRGDDEEGLEDLLISLADVSDAFTAVYFSQTSEVTMQSQQQTQP